LPVIAGLSDIVLESPIPVVFDHFGGAHSPLLRIDDGHLLNLLATWVPDAALRTTILVDNPATLYAF
jgi:hypothetical protein